MSPAKPRVLTINGGSSSIRFALYELGERSSERLRGKDRSHRPGRDDADFDDPTGTPPDERACAGSKSAADRPVDWLAEQECLESVRAVGHRVVHGMQHTEPERVTAGAARRAAPHRARTTRSTCRARSS